MLLSHHQNVGQNRDIKKTNTLFANVAQFKCLGTTVTNQNLIQEEIKRRLNLGNACYHSILNLLSSHLLSKNVKINIYKYKILTKVINLAKKMTYEKQSRNKKKKRLELPGI
jgi:hypothetical protein